jgi:outer membrane protein insertion porin family
VGSPVLRRVAAVLALALAARSAPAQDPVGAPPVTRVTVRSETAIDVDEVRPLIDLVPGEPFDEARVRRTIRSLRLSGLAAEVEVLAAQAAGGVEAIVVLRPDLRVVEIALEGDTGIDVKRLAPRVPQRVGAPLREDRLLRGVYALQDELDSEGYLDAGVRLAVEVDEPARQARVVYRIEAGARTRVGDVRFDGLPAGIERERALETVRAKPGEALKSEVVRNDQERLQHLLIRSGFRTAAVEAAAVARRDGLPVADLTWRIAAGPQVELELVGAERKPLERRGLLPFLGEAGYDEALLVQATGLIRADFQSRGHYDVHVTGEERREGDDRLVVRLEIDPGPRLTLEEVEFEGNETFSDERLGQLMLTAPRRLLTPGSGRLVEDVLQEDLSNLRSFYALSGFDRARIGPPRVERPRPDELRLVIPVDEGARRTTADVVIAGVTALDADDLAGSLALRPGGPFHRLLLESSVETLRERLELAGYRSALISTEVDWSSDRTVARVTLRVLEGERSTVGAVLLRGNARTESAILRRFLGIERGDPISTSRLLGVQRRLYSLGVFSRVDVSVPPAGAGAASREVLVDVAEGRSRAVALGAGYDSEGGARGLARLSESNLAGRLVSVQLDALVSQEEEAYRLSARQPYLFRTLAEVSASVYQESESRDAYETERRGAQIGLVRAFGRLQVGLLYDYRIVETLVRDPGIELPRESREGKVASLAPNLFYDRRDDPLDPTRGWTARAVYERAAPLFAADADFDKLFGQLTGYVDLGGVGILAASLRAGAIENRRSTTDDGVSGIDLVPAAERFFAGGRSSHRAFPLDELGIPGETLALEPGGSGVVPLGGGALAIANLELRFPIAGAFGGLVFTDVGNVWREVDDFDPGDARWGVGAGLRYLSPIGPLRLEVGWPLDRRDDEETYVWFVSLGYAF